MLAINQNGLSNLNITTGTVHVGPSGLALSANSNIGINVTAPTSGAGALTININNTGNVTLSGALGHTGGIVINRFGGGTPSIGNYSGDITFGGSQATTLSNTMTAPSGGIQLKSSASALLTYAGVISGSG